MSRERIHRRIREILELLEINNNRLFLSDQGPDDFDKGYLKQLVRNLYEEVEKLGLASVESTSSSGEVSAPFVEPTSQEYEEKPELETKEVVADELEIVVSEQPVELTEPEKEIIPEVIENQTESINLKSEHVELPVEEPKVETNQRIPAEQEPPVTVKPTVIKQPLPGSDIYARLQHSKIDSLKKAISISKRFELQSILFKNDPDRYNEALKQLDSSDSLESAFALFDSFKLQYGWEDENELVEELQTILLRRYM